MEQGLRPFEIRDIDAGIQAKTSDLAMEDEFQRFPLSIDTKNWSFGKRKGLTTRYGIMPFPGHASADLSAESFIPSGSLTGYKPFNLIAAEGSLALPHPSKTDSFRRTYDVYEKRTSVLGATIFSQAVQPKTNTENYPVLYWLTMRQRSKTGSTAYQFDAAPSTVWRDVYSDGQEIVSQYEATVGGGSSIITQFQAVAASEDDSASFLANNARILTADPFRIRTTTNTEWFIRYEEHKYNFTAFSSDFVAGGQSTISSTKPSDAYFSALGFPYIAYKPRNDSRSLTVQAGLVNTSFKTWTTNINLTQKVEKSNDLLVSGGRFRTYGQLLSFGPPKYEEESGFIDLNSSSVTWTVTETPALGDAAYMFKYCSHEPYSISVSMQILAAVFNGNPILCVKNDAISDKTETALKSLLPYTTNVTSNYENDYLMFANPSENVFAPQEYDTTVIGAATLYSEKFGTTASVKRTCWKSSAPFDSTVASSTVVANKGVLEQNKIYEYTYTIKNMINGVESNVGTPAKVFTGATANGGILVFKGDLSLGEGALLNNASLLPNITAYIAAITKNPALAVPSVSAYLFPFNYFSYVFYYRELGSFEWVYSGEVSFPRLYFKQFSEDIYIGAADAIGLPGPQPGGYVDSSPLPKDTYIDVKSFAGKLWWVAKDAVRFSSSNAFVYPVRNFISASSGEFRGAIVHYFPGQAEARGRLVVFGNKAMYDIRQTSEFLYTQVRVSASSQPQAVPIPDSNFSVAERSTHTAFSGRTAVVAEGALYYWGPSGIFRDDGVNLPVRISDAIEPDLFDSYNKTRTDEFFAHYNKKSQEILFFYRPADESSGELTKAWVYSTRVEDFQNGRYGAWSQYSYKCLIDWAQEIDLTGFYGGKIGETAVAPRGAGLRTLIGARASNAATVSRPYFHDDLCDCGDMTPGTEMMVKSASRIDASTVRLTFTSDHNSTILASASAGSSVYIFGSQEYGKLSVSLDGIREVTAVGAGTLDIKDSSAFAGTSTLATASFFPVFFPNYHSIPCNIDTNFFAPYGVTLWSRFRYSQLVFQPVERRNGTVDASATISWNCNHTLDTITSKTVKLERLNNRERTSQIVFDMASPGMQAEGQGIEFRVNYQQLGPRWTLFSWTTWIQPLEGARNLLTYQQ